MKRLIGLMLVCMLCSSCAFVYHNEKSIVGRPKNVKLPKMGTIEDAKVIFRSTVDFWFPTDAKIPKNEGIKHVRESL